MDKWMDHFRRRTTVGRGFDEGVRTGRDRGSDEPQVTRRAIVTLTDPAAV